MRIIYCFMPPSSGDVSVYGVDVRDNPSSIKARIGVMPQEDNLDPDLTVFENLLVYARYFDIPRRDSAPLARELLNFVGLQEKVGVKFGNLSGGMKRRMDAVPALGQHSAAILAELGFSQADIEELSQEGAV